jgi:TM2 domain-containing membrane protein YozV
VDYRHFEREFLRLAFTTDVELSPAMLAFAVGISIREAETHLQALVTQGTLTLEVDDDGRLIYEMPERPTEPLPEEHPIALAHRPVLQLVETNTEHGHALMMRSLPPTVWEPPQVTSGQAVASMFLNALVCPGVGSMVGGRTGVGLAQLSLFLVGLPLAAITVGMPLMLAAWVWGIATGAQLIAEARD